MAQPAVSAITMALNAANAAGKNGTASSSIDIATTQPKFGSARFTAAAKHQLGLPPTPPNSYSPALLAQAARADYSSPPPAPLDAEASDIADLADKLTSLPLSREALSGLERSEVITPTMLAKDHLPKIMLDHGDMAIRQIMACLNHDVSGFSKIEPARARRIVVAALESRMGGGADGDIHFVKVGWGRWVAHVKGQKPARAISSSRNRMISPADSDVAFSTSYGSYPGSKRKRPFGLGQSYTGSDMPSLDEHLEDMSMSEHEVENMSIDGSNSSDSDVDSAEEETDEEDWAAIGAAAMRRRASKASVNTGSTRRNYNLLCIPGPVYKRRYSTTSSVARSSKTRVASSAPADHFISHRYLSQPNFNDHKHQGGAGPMDIDNEKQERDAARALLSLGSM